ncbi:hypothetical protein [Sphingomonas sp.]|uniref:hypothetical protein n=1 Tax=Sphingomonas sp. TaxID=28214 RepID=UPI001ED26179|nr:hypothetical protein [Sphingomonas sp.]MBX3594959.1 hypothetical protein [Sphingomonas sp.]
MLRSTTFIGALALTATAMSAPAFAQRLGTPTHSMNNPDRDEPAKPKAEGTPESEPTGAAIQSVEIKAGEKKVLLAMAGDDGATMVHLADGPMKRTAIITATLTVKGSTSTLKVANASGGTFDYTIEGDPSGAGKWAAAGEASVKDRQTSSTDYQVELKAVRLSGFKFTKKK